MKKSVLIVKTNFSGGYIDFEDADDLNGRIIDTKETAYYHEDNDDKINSPFKALEFEIEDSYMNVFYKVYVDAHFLNVNKEEITFGFEGAYGAFFKVHFKNDLSAYAERVESEELKMIKQEYIMPTIIPWEDDMINNFL